MPINDPLTTTSATPVFMGTGAVDSRFRGNDGAESGNDGVESGNDGAKIVNNSATIASSRHCVKFIVPTRHGKTKSRTCPR